MRQPSAIAHMGWNGVSRGFVLGAMYGILIYLGILGLDPVSSIGFVELFNSIVGIGLTGGIIGAIFGLPMGIAAGIGLSVAVRGYSFPINPPQMQELKTTGQVICLVVTMLAFGFILLASSSFDIDLASVIFVVIPLSISFIAAIRAMNRYLKKLNTLAGGKSKAKREAA